MSFISLPFKSMREAERRAAVRYSLPPGRTAQSVVDEQGSRREAQVRNISATGIAVIVDHRFEPGALLTVEFAVKEGNTRTLRARVVRVERDSTDRWLAGCSLLQRLSDYELLALL